MQSWRLLASSVARSLRILCGTSLDDRVRIGLDRAVIRILGSRLDAAVAGLAARAMGAVHMRTGLRVRVTAIVITRFAAS